MKNIIKLLLVLSLGLHANESNTSNTNQLEECAEQLQEAVYRVDDANFDLEEREFKLSHKYFNEALDMFNAAKEVCENTPYEAQRLQNIEKIKSILNMNELWGNVL